MFLYIYTTLVFNTNVTAFEYCKQQWENIFHGRYSYVAISYLNLNIYR